MFTLTAKNGTFLKKGKVGPNGKITVPQGKDLPNNQRITVKEGKSYSVDDAPGPLVDGNQLVNLAWGFGSWYVYPPDWSGWPIDLVNLPTAEHVFDRAPSDEQLADLNKCLIKFNINTKARIRHFLAQCGAESGGLRYMTEIWGPTPDQLSYEGRRDLGNTQPGDGKRFRGTSVIQLTGRANFQAFADYIGDQGVMQGADYVAEHYPFTAAGFWWKQNMMNSLIDGGANVLTVSRAVNLGNPYSSYTPNGLDDREYYYDRACEVLI